MPEGFQIEKVAAQTKIAMVSGVKTIFEAGFLAGDLYSAVDILRRVQEGWHLIEVKPGTLKGVRRYLRASRSEKYAICTGDLV